MEFKSRIQLDGKTATGIPVPAEIVARLGGGKRPRVRVTLNSHTYRTTVGRVHGEFKLPVGAAVREEAGVAAGDDVTVTIEPDAEPRELTIPPELTEAMVGNPAAREAFEKLSYSNRKRHALAVEGAKKPETRERRIAKILKELDG